MDYMNHEAAITGKRWDFSSKGYNDIIQKEFSEVGQTWVDLLKEYAPCQTGKALDVGMGPGFFTVLLAEMGWEVTGIDCAEQMVREAEKNLAVRNLKAECRVMDSHVLDFADNTFDYIVARNATWLLYDPQKAFSEWLRVLRPGGRLMYLDANWPYLDDPQLLKDLDEAYRQHEEKYGNVFDTYTGDKKTNEDFQKLVVFSHIYRPTWDEQKLPEIGYCNVIVKKRMNEVIYPLWKQELYDAMDEFLVTAEKPL